MIWLFNIRKAFKIPKLFTIFKDDDSGEMSKVMLYIIVFLLMMLGGLVGCASISTISSPVGTATQAVAGP